MNRKCSDVNLSIVHGFLPCKELFYFTKQIKITIYQLFPHMVINAHCFFFLLFFSCSLLSDFHYIRVISFFLQCFGTLGFILYLPTQQSHYLPGVNRTLHCRIRAAYSPSLLSILTCTDVHNSCTLILCDFIT